MGRLGCVSAVAISLAGLGISHVASAQQSVLAAGGFTGLSVTPTARLLPWGTMAFSYDNEIVGGPSVGSAFGKYGTSGHNFVAGFGVLRYLEVSGRLATNKIQDNCYTEGCGLRDLSLNFKAGFPLDSAGKWNFAAGATDFGGDVTVFRTMYGVITYSPEKFDVSAGFARRGTGLTGSTRPLDGPFGSIAYRPLSWLQTHVEYNDSKAWTGIQLFAPTSWMPSGWTAHLSANFRVRGNEGTSKSWFGAGLSIPLYKVPTTRPEAGIFESKTQSEAKTNSPIRTNIIEDREFTKAGLDESAPLQSSISEAKSDSSTVQIDVHTPAQLSDDMLIGISEQLEKKGFEDIRVGRLGQGIAVQVNNATYNVNTVDGLGVALGVIARTLRDYKTTYTLVLTQRQIPIIGVSGETECLVDWVAMRVSTCAAGQLFTPGFENLTKFIDAAQWVVDGKAPSWKTVRISFQPLLRSALATEYGVFDYSAGLKTTVQQPLWSGAYVEAAYNSPISNSSDYDRGGVYSGGRIKNGIDRVLFHQIFRVPLELIFPEVDQSKVSKLGTAALTAHVAAGKINENYQGVYGELRWEPFAGRHRFGLEGGQFDSTRVESSLPTKAKSILASYRYSFDPTRTDFELTAGQFLYSDQGMQISVGQWFDDVLLNFYYRQTKFSYETAARKFVGVEIVIPLTPRKDMTPKNHLQITGAPRWSYAVETRVGGTNFVSADQGVFPGAAVLDRTFNSDRAGVYYFEENMARIRSAAAR